MHSILGTFHRKILSLLIRGRQSCSYSMQIDPWYTYKLHINSCSIPNTREPQGRNTCLPCGLQKKVGPSVECRIQPSKRRRTREYRRRRRELVRTRWRWKDEMHPTSSMKAPAARLSAHKPTESSWERLKAAMHAKLVRPVITSLQKGADVRKVAESLAVGFCIGLFPIFGTIVALLKLV